MSATTAPPAGPRQLEHYGRRGDAPWMSVDWQAHQRWETLGGEVINVIDLGKGPPIVWVHGLGGSWQNWLEQLPEFSEHNRSVAIDLPGFGASPMPDGEISIAGYGRALAGLLDRLDIPKAVVVGNSMGGFIAAELAISAPERVEKLVLVSAAGLSTDRIWLRPAKTAARMTAFASAWVGAHSDELTRRPRARRVLASGVFRRPDRLAAPLMAEQFRGTGKPGFLGALEALATYPIRERLPEISAPTLVVWGTHDYLVPVRDADEFERLIPNAEKVIFAQTGHVPQLERPEAFNGVLREFLDR
jgi:pimeloyl-ACP methyl ester carboxylesterase